MLADEVLRVGERPFGSGTVRRPSGMYAVASVCEKSLERGPIVNKKKGTAESEKMTLTIWNEIWVCQSSQKESLKTNSAFHTGSRLFLIVLERWGLFPSRAGMERYTYGSENPFENPFEWRGAQRAVIVLLF